MSSRSSRVVDVFPQYFSEEPLQRLTNYPEKNFLYWGQSKTVQKQIFICFMTHHDKIYYYKKQSFEKSESAIQTIGKECQKFDKLKFDPKKISFTAIKKRLKKSPAEEEISRVNADTRLAFKIGNQYLVKCYFTSGLRTVEQGTAHIVQTLQVPVLLYIKPKRVTSKYFHDDRRDEKCFPYDKLHLYDLSILPPNSANRIPSGTRYVLLTVQKTYFTFDIVPDTYKIPFKIRDPVKHKLTKLRGCGDDLFDGAPPETPYIENVNLESEEEEEEETTVFPQMEQLMQSEQFMQSEQQTVLQEQPSEQQTVFQEQPSEQLMQGQTVLQQPSEQQTVLQQPSGQQITFWLLPTTQEKNVLKVSVDFAENYRRLKESNRLDSEPHISFPIFPSLYDCEEPMDLSSSLKPNVDGANVDEDILQEATRDIFNDELMKELDKLLMEPENISSSMDFSDLYTM